MCPALRSGSSSATGLVGTKTVFQIGSTTKAFLAAKLAIAVDRKRLKWDDRVVDLDPTFSLKDPYVTREFRIYDLLAQRSGLPPYANDPLWIHLYFDAEWLMHSLRFVEPITSFRSTFAYTNITHLIAGRIVVKALDAPDWPTLARREILAPLGMSDASFTAARSCGWPPLDRDGLCPDPIRSILSLPGRPRRRHQCERRGLRALAATADRKRGFCRSSADLSRQSRGNAHAKGRDQRNRDLRDGLGERNRDLRNGLDHQCHTERSHHLARCRHQRVRRANWVSAR